MKNILTELYYGNIDPQARGFKKDSYLQKQMNILSNCEEVLTESLTGDDKIVCPLHPCYIFVAIYVLFIMNGININHFILLSVSLTNKMSS